MQEEKCDRLLHKPGADPNIMDNGETPLHSAAYSGDENIGFNPLHLACKEGQATAVSLLLSKSPELLESKDASGRTSLHIAAINGYKQVVEVLLSQGAEADAVDNELWTPLICASNAGHSDIVKLLVESEASTLAKTSKSHSAIWFAASGYHKDVLSYLMKKDYDSYGLMDDEDFVLNLAVCGKNDDELLTEFVLSSTAPADVAVKLSNILKTLSVKEKRSKDLLIASKHCEAMASELLSLAAATTSGATILEAIDRKGVAFVDVLIENEQKEVIARPVVQKHVQELWTGHLHWTGWKVWLLFFTFLLVPPVWVAFSFPIGRYHKTPIIKFMSFLTSHVHFMTLLRLTCVTPIYPVFPIRSDLYPFWFEWMLLTWVVGLLVSEITNPNDKNGFRWIKMAVLGFSISGILLHCFAFFLGSQSYGVILYLRNQLLGIATCLACFQFLEFLSINYLFGSWVIIIGHSMKILAKFLAVLIVYIASFALLLSALNHPISTRRPVTQWDKRPSTLTNGLPSGVLVTPFDAFELLVYTFFGYNGALDLQIETRGQPDWTLILFKAFYVAFKLVFVLDYILIAMIFDTYQKIQGNLDIEWKYELAKMIRRMQRTSAAPSPLNLIITPVVWIFERCTKDKLVQKENQSEAFPKGAVSFLPNDNEDKPTLWQKQRIETVIDWPLISKKYRLLFGKIEPAV